jgi:hypothetical protein
MKIKLNNVRLAFPALFEAKAVNAGDKPAFSATLILPKDHPAIPELQKAIVAVAKEKWGEKHVAMLTELKAKDKLALHDGDGKARFAGFAGNLYISARNEARPLVLDENKSPVTAADGKVYGGCYVNAVVDVWAQDNSYGKRVNTSLSGVQFYADGEPFAGGGVASADDFEPVAGASAKGDPATSIFD